MTKSSNKNLHRAKRAKNDEFYTRLEDIENELKHYRDHFCDKVVFLNCDDPEESNFFRYFQLNFSFLGLKKLISTHYDPEKPTYRLDIVRAGHGHRPIRTELEQNGDFRSPECIELLQQADIVVTNPPFSLFREYLAQLVEYDKRFLIIGNINAISYKEVFKLIKDNQLWLGTQRIKEFVLPDGSSTSTAAIWFTDLDHARRHEPLILYREYDDELYPTYDNYDAIEVSRVKDIPCDYFGTIGVPITFLEKFCPEQFEIVGIDRPLVEELTGKVSRFFTDGKEVYARIVIRRRDAD